MRLSGRIALYAAAVAGVLIAATAWLALRLWAEVTHPGYPTTQVPRAWRIARESPGHLAHVEEAKVPCRDCHDLAKGVTSPPPGTCEGCHADVTTPLHASPMAAGVPCIGCHDFQGAHGPGASAWDCLGCHAEPQGFETRAVAPHGDAACSTCHRPHTSPSLAPPDCGECHAEKETRHAGLAATTEGAACASCHSAHEKAADVASRCLGCHKTEKPAITERALVGHDTCTTCHDGHAFDRGGVASCKTAACHGAQPVLAASSGHRDCQSCHAPHDPSRPKACASCHPTVHPDHPASAGGCLGCHPIHDRALVASKAPAQACASCHRGEDGHAAKQACDGCHQPHAVRTTVAKLACATCHKDPARTVEGTGHARCTTCHAQAAHAPEAAPGTCTSCHAPQATQVARVAQQGHARCEGCHSGGAHAPTRRESCASCHRDEARTAFEGHTQCASCHAPHDGARVKQCADCHQDRTRGHGSPKLLGKGALAKGCDSCHRPHGPDGPASPPACTTCHDRAKLPGLHAVGEHASCTSCHDAHVPAPRADRATCIGCHTAQRDHEPAAKVCNGCHVFGR